jgi:hypothetical protein
MSRSISVVALWCAAACVAAPVGAQVSPRTAAEQRQSRYQIGVTERVLEGAVEHAATVIRDRLQEVGPSQILMVDNAQARGFRLDGYGVFFDVVVPSFQGTMLWSLRALDQNNLGLESALNKLKSYFNHSGDADLQQAFRRIELQVAPLASAARLASAAAGLPGAADVTGSAAGVVDRAPTAPGGTDDVFSDLNGAYRNEVMRALKDAMLDYSGPLGVGPDEWLTIAARSNEERARLAPADSDARTIIIRARGADLSAFRTGQVSRQIALERINQRVF